MTASPRLLEAAALRRVRPDGTAALLDDVSIDVRGGDRIAVAGPTGAGKTLLLRALALLDPLDGGEVRWRGEVVRGRRVPAFRREVVYLHQRAPLLDSNVETNLRFPFTLRAGRGARFDACRAAELLEALGRHRDFLSRDVETLSGGEAQLVALVRALQIDPAVLLLDEPTAALDGEAARAAEALVERWRREDPDRRAFVWVSHDDGQAARVASRVLAMAGGRLEDAA